MWLAMSFRRCIIFSSTTSWCFLDSGILDWGFCLSSLSYILVRVRGGVKEGGEMKGSVRELKRVRESNDGEKGSKGMKGTKICE